MKVLVTGGSGFIGQHLVNELAKAGYQVVSADIREPSHRLVGVQYALVDICKAAEMQPLIHSVDMIFHLAGIVSVPECHEKVAESYETNVNSLAGIIKILRQANARRTQPIKLVFTSSSAVYGEQDQQVAISERAPLPDLPRSFYGAQKLAGEHILRLARLNDGLPVMILRLFNVYGKNCERSRESGAVIPSFIRALWQGEFLRLHGGGAQMRDFVAVEDVIRAMFATISAPTEYFDGRPINIGSGRGITVKDLAELLVQLGGLESTIVEEGPRVGDINFSLADIRLAYEKLEWRPKVLISAGLEKLLRDPVWQRPISESELYLGGRVGAEALEAPSALH